MQRRKILLQLLEVFHVRTAPRVDRLVIVADRGEHAGLARQHADQLVLRGIRILIFVDQQVAQPGAPLRQQHRLILEQVGRQADQIIEIDGLVREQCVLIGAVDLGQMQLPFGSGPRQRPIRGNPVVFQQ